MCTIRPRTGRVIVGAVALAIALALPSSGSQPNLDARLSGAAGSASFDLVTWEASTLAARWLQALFRPERPDQGDQVVKYLHLAAEESKVRAARDTAWARSQIDGSGDLPAAQAQLDAIDGQLAAMRPAVETTISAQIEAELGRQSLRVSLFTITPSGGFPPFRPNVFPGVFFQLGTLPDLLVVAPTDRIEIVGSVLVDPGLSPGQIDTLETRADGLGYSSVVTGIGGLAAYPSMLPDGQSARDLLVTVAHEWTHHYLAFRPLGMAYFDDYEMRSINETVADMVGREIGGAVYERTYAPLEPPRPPATSRPAPSGPPPPDFWTLMSQIRSTTEVYLARHDVAGANAYMADQRKELTKYGFFIRRLNTAYLSFFGSYSGGGNPDEPKLKLLRSRSGSLAQFLETVSQVRTPSDLNRLLYE